MLVLGYLPGFTYSHKTKQLQFYYLKFDKITTKYCVSCPSLEALMWILTAPLKQKRKRRKRGGTTTATLSSIAREQLGATRTEAVRKERDASDGTLTLRTLNMKTVSRLKNAAAQTPLMPAVIIYPAPIIPPLQTVQLTTTSMDTQVSRLFHIQAVLQIHHDAEVNAAVGRVDLKVLI